MTNQQNGSSEWVTFLGQTLLLGGLTDSQLGELATIAIVREYDKDASLFQQGDAATGFFIIQSGRIKVFKLAQDGREQILHIFGALNHFAEVPALDGKPYPASAAAIEQSTVLFFPRQPFLLLLSQQPDLAINLLKSFARHLRHFSNLVDDLTLREVPARLANYLLQQSQQTQSQQTQSQQTQSQQTQSQQAETVTLDISKGQLAARLGTIPETLSRILAKFKRQGLVEVRGIHIQLLDVEQLRALANHQEDE